MEVAQVLLQTDGPEPGSAASASRSAGPATSNRPEVDEVFAALEVSHLAPRTEGVVPSGRGCQHTCSPARPAARPLARTLQELGLRPGRDCAVGDTGITLDLGLYLNGTKASACRCCRPRPWRARAASLICPYVLTAGLQACDTRTRRRTRAFPVRAAWLLLQVAIILDDGGASGRKAFAMRRALEAALQVGFVQLGTCLWHKLVSLALSHGPWNSGALGPRGTHRPSSPEASSTHNRPAAPG